MRKTYPAQRYAVRHTWYKGTPVFVPIRKFAAFAEMARVWVLKKAGAAMTVRIPALEPRQTGDNPAPADQMLTAPIKI